MTDIVQLATTDQVAQITLNRPDSYNALNLETAHALSRLLFDLGADSAIHGIIITGAGAAFSAGGDLRFAQTHPHGPAAAFHELATMVHLCVTEIRRMPKPVLAALNGVAAGAASRWRWPATSA
jgi:2-(1,2-epoxy-1,2-dihydrophenyl)acetyl-CoA isomerase